MDIAWKDSFIIRKFKIIITVAFVVSFFVFTLLTFFITKHLIGEQVKSNLISEFMGVNNNNITKPITSGILENTEVVYVLMGNKVIYDSSLNKNRELCRGLELVMAKNTGGKDNLQVKLFVDMKKRINDYFKIYYLVIIPLIFLFGLTITLLSYRKLKKWFERLYTFIDNVKEFESHGVDFNRIRTYNTNDEVGIMSREFDKLSNELVKMRHKERQLVNDASHELKTPLAIIEGNLPLLDKKSYTEESRNVARELIKSSVFSAKALIDNLIDLNSEEIIVKEKIQSENITEILTQIIEDYKKIYIDYTFKIDFDEISYPIRKLDIVKLANILFENAVKYSSDDLKEIEVKIKQKGNKILFSVTDYGIGMSRENVEKVFDKFWRADTSRARNTGGTGIGLSIAQKICEKYEFKINVASALNMGTTVTVEFS